MDSLRRQHPSSFHFKENTASIATQYSVTITKRGSRRRPLECILTVHRERLCHQPPRRLPSFLDKLGKHFNFFGLQRNDPKILCERLMHDIHSISFDASNQSAFS